VAAERSTRVRSGKRAPQRTGATEAETTRPPTPARQYVDIDPWAMLLEQLMEVPEGEPAERKGGKIG